MHGPAEPPHDLTDLAQLRAASVREGSVDGDSGHSGFRRRVRPPAFPGLKRMHEGVLDAVFSCFPVAQDRRERAVHARIGGPVKAVEVLPGAWLISLRVQVGQSRHVRYNGRSYTPRSLSSVA